MAADIGGFDAVVLRGLFPHLEGFDLQLAMAVGAAAAPFIEREGRCNPIAMVLGQPLSAVECSGGFLAAG